MTAAGVVHPGAQRTAAVSAVEALRDLGIKTVFGIPGVHNQGLYDALITVPGVRSIVTRHEQGAAFMADGFARSTGQVGVCFLITGPGLTNAATAIAEAYSDSVPMLCVVTCYSDGLEARGRRLHDLRNQTKVIDGLFKASHRVRSPRDLAGTIALAYREALEGRPGPVAVEVPIEFLDQKLGADGQTTPTAHAELPPRTRSLRTPSTTSRLKGARPVVVVGGGCAAASSEVTALVERLGAVALSTASGKGVLPEDHPLSLGTWLKSETSRRVVAQADPLILLGTEWSTTDLGDAPYALPKNIVRVDADPEPHPVVGIDIVGDVAEVVGDWLSAWAGDPRQESWIHVQELRQAARAEPRRWPRLALECIESLRQALDRDAIVVNDMNTLSYAAVELLESGSPRRFLFPRGYGTLGYAVPAAIGACLASPKSQVVAVCGDGGFLFTSEELATAVRLRLNLPIIVWNNESFGAIRATRTAAYGRSVDDDLVNPDFSAYAKAFGAAGVRVASAAELGSAVASALTRHGPTVIDVAAG